MVVGSEILLIIVVALLVFNPKKLPMLANHLGILVRKTLDYKRCLTSFWQQQLDLQQLADNEQKANDADILYQIKQKEKSTH
jgi:sec-independent protein translocase protein TatB